MNSARKSATATTGSESVRALRGHGPHCRLATPKYSATIRNAIELRKCKQLHLPTLDVVSGTRQWQLP